MTIEELSKQMNKRFDTATNERADIAGNLFVLEKKIDTLNNKLDIIIKLNSLKVSSSI